MIQALLECGADAESVDKHGNNAISVLFKHFQYQFSASTKLKLLLYYNTSLEKVPFAFPFVLDTVLKSYSSRSLCQGLHETSRFQIITDSVHVPDSKSNVNDLLQLLLPAGSSPEYTELVRLNCTLYRLLDDVLHTVSEIRSLKVLSRTVLRRHFVGRQIHRFVENMKLPVSVREFILFERLLR